MLSSLPLGAPALLHLAKLLHWACCQHGVTARDPDDELRHAGLDAISEVIGLLLRDESLPLSPLINDWFKTGVVNMLAAATGDLIRGNMLRGHRGRLALGSDIRHLQLSA